MLNMHHRADVTRITNYMEVCLDAVASCLFEKSEIASQTQDSKFDPWWSEAVYATPRSRAPHNNKSTRVSGEETFFIFET